LRARPLEGELLGPRPPLTLSPIPPASPLAPRPGARRYCDF
jgi:hypothetical protein